ncbi:MAG: tRNA-splicing endonuclease subunit sen54 [Sclerophora amabilis]|nr:MAG: tRNA-splicing endonuclease subunit sen54 [Sclerophora amabilis]
MADADEDDLLGLSHNTGEIDLTDETQDFQFLPNLTQTDHPTIPRRGEKDFEPHGTTHQSSLLAASRLAMHDALSSTRIHNPKNHILGHWYPAPRNQCCVPHPRGPHFKSMGKQDREGKLWLLPEEMLYLLERGNLDVRWPPSSEERGEKVLDSDEQLGVPMSLQGGYAVVIGKEEEGKISLERWAVYAGLRRSGYAVLRAPTWGPPTEEEAKERKEQEDLKLEVRGEKKEGERRGIGDVSLLERLLGPLFRSTGSHSPPLPMGPLVQPGLYRNYNEIYRLLSVIPYYDPTTATDTIATKQQPPNEPSRPTSTPEPSFRIAFHIHKPSPTFRKSSPGIPDFRIAVLSARDSTTPTLAQLSSLLDSVPFDPPLVGTTNTTGCGSAASKDEPVSSSTTTATARDPPPNAGRMYQRLKHGSRNCILAIVDQGVVSYLRFGEAVFGREGRVYEFIDAGRGRGRGGGRGGQGGRGRGGRGGGRGKGGGRGGR